MSRKTSSSAPWPVVAGGQLDRVPGVEEIGELHALDHPAGVDVETGDHPDGAHAATPSSTVIRPSTRARPLMTPASRRTALPAPPTGHRGRPASSTSPAEATPPEAITGMLRRHQHLAQAVHVGTAQHAVALDGGHDDGGHTGTRQIVEELDHGAPAPLLPAPDGHLGAPVGAEPVVDPDGHLAGEGGGQPAGQPGIVEGQRAEHHPAHPAGQQLADVLLGAHSPAGLDRDVDGGGDGQHRRAVDRARPPGRRRGRPRAASGRRRRRTGGPAPPGPRSRTGGRSPPGRGARRRRRGCRWPGRGPSRTAGRRRRGRSWPGCPGPTAPDFSGWNWVPHTGPRSAEAVTGPP